MPHRGMFLDLWQVALCAIIFVISSAHPGMRGSRITQFPRPIVIIIGGLPQDILGAKGDINVGVAHARTLGGIVKFLNAVNCNLSIFGGCKLHRAVRGVSSGMFHDQMDGEPIGQAGINPPSPPARLPLVNARLQVGIWLSPSRCGNLLTHSTIVQRCPVPIRRLSTYMRSSFGEEEEEEDSLD